MVLRATRTYRLLDEDAMKLKRLGTILWALALASLISAALHVYDAHLDREYRTPPTRPAWIPLTPSTPVLMIREGYWTEAMYLHARRYGRPLRDDPWCRSGLDTSPTRRAGDLCIPRVRR